jgi:drug/metabolite transporter (DMT)-like permease
MDSNKSESEHLVKSRTPAALLSGLVVINLLWAGNPVMTKFMLEDFVPLQVAWLRITSSTIVLGVLLGLAKGRTKPTGGAFVPWSKAALMGAIVFFATPLVVTFGLNQSLAIQNSFITGLEPVITVLLAWLILRERMRASQWVILAVATAGFVMLSGLANRWIGLVAASHVAGNLLLLSGMAGEAMFSILGGPMVRRTAPGTLLLTGLATGALLLTVYLAVFGTIPNPAHLTGRSLLGLLWAGPIATAGCYYVWLASLQHIAVNTAAFTLFVQPLVGAVMGYVLLSERIGVLQSCGAGLILSALVVHVYLVVHRTRIRNQVST